MTGTARISAAMLLVLLGTIPVYLQAATLGPVHAGQARPPSAAEAVVCENPGTINPTLTGLSNSQTNSQSAGMQTDDRKKKSSKPKSKSKKVRPQESEESKESKESKESQKSRESSKKKRTVEPQKIDPTKTKETGPTKKLRKALPEENSAPLNIFANIEAGWKTQNVQQILRHFGKGKVAISIGGIGPSGGRFSKSQSFYLLKDLFKYTITKKFEFVQYRNLTNGKRKVFAIAERYYKRSDDGRLFKDKIYVSLSLEGDRWVIDEIKSTR